MVSIIVPSYNTPAGWLEECLGSVLAQTSADWEAIVVDDASREPVEARLRGAIREDSRLRVIRHPENRGLAAARNTGAAAASGGLLLMLDSDDRLAPGYLESMTRAIGRADCAACDFRVFGEAGGTWRYPPKGPREMILDQWLPGPGVLLRKGLVERVGGYPEDQAFRLGNEDWDFWLGAAEAGFKAAYLPEALYEYRVSASSLSNTAMKRGYYRTVEAMYARHKAFIDGQGLERKFRHDGYYFSIRRCPSDELAFVAREALRLAGGPGETLRVAAALAKRAAKGAASALTRAARGRIR